MSAARLYCISQRLHRRKSRTLQLTRRQLWNMLLDEGFFILFDMRFHEFLDELFLFSLIFTITSSILLNDSVFPFDYSAFTS